LVAPQNSAHDEDGSDNSRGYYEDGAYIASQDDSVQHEVNTTASTDATYINAQDAYHASLISRFMVLRTQLAGRPPDALLDALDVAAQPTTFFHDAADKARWQQLMITADPLAAQLAAMTQASVLGVLQIAGWLLKRKRLLARGGEGRRIGAWTWGLLGRVGEVGTLSSVEVAMVREMGKQAATVIAGLVDSDEEIVERGPEDVHDSESGDMEDYSGQVCREHGGAHRIIEGDVTDEVKAELPHVVSFSGGETKQVQTAAGTAGEAALEGARTRLLNRHLGSTDQDDMATASDSDSVDDDSEFEANSNAQRPEGCRESAAKSVQSTDPIAVATLDAILTIVGECYGQRDLLASRDKLWELEH